MSHVGPVVGSVSRMGVLVRWGDWYGVGVFDHRVLPPLFSERHRPGKLAHYWHVGPWCLRLFVPQAPVNTQGMVDDG